MCYSNVHRHVTVTNLYYATSNAMLLITTITVVVCCVLANYGFVFGVPHEVNCMKERIGVMKFCSVVYIICAFIWFRKWTMNFILIHLKTVTSDVKIKSTPSRFTQCFFLFSQLQIYLTCAAILIESKTRSLTCVTLKVIVHGVGWPCSVIGYGETHLRARGTR
jgi:hypothetical protein